MERNPVLKTDFYPQPPPPLTLKIIAHFVYQYFYYYIFAVHIFEYLSITSKPISERTI